MRWFLASEQKKNNEDKMKKLTYKIRIRCLIGTEMTTIILDKILRKPSAGGKWRKQQIKQSAGTTF